MTKMFTENYNLWTTKSGDTLFFGEMTDSHILNAYRMVIKIKIAMMSEQDSIWSFSFQGEQAQYAQDQVIDSMQSKIDEVCILEEQLMEEIKARRLEKLI